MTPTYLPGIPGVDFEGSFTAQPLNPGLLTHAGNLLANGDPAISQGFSAGGNIGQALFGNGALGRVREVLSPEQVELFMRQKAESYQGGQRSPEAASALSMLQGAAQSEGQSIDPYVKQALELRQSQLGGFSPQEFQLMRETGAEQLNRQLQTGLRAANLRNNVAGIEGGARGIVPQDLAVQALQARRGLERDLQVENLAEKQRRLSGFENLAQSVSNENFQRRNASINNYNNALFGREQFETADRAARLQAFTDFQRGLEDFVLQRQVFNLGQAAAEKSGYLSSFLGGGQFAAAQQGRKTAEELAREQIAAAREAKLAPGIDLSPFAALAGGFQEGGFPRYPFQAPPKPVGQTLIPGALESSGFVSDPRLK